MTVLDQPGSYITWPDTIYPGETVFPDTSIQVPADTRRVKGRDGACWTRVHSGPAIAVNQLIVDKLHTALDALPGGTINYYTATTPDTAPPVEGKRVGETYRARDGQGRVLAEWVWDGEGWRRISMAATALGPVPLDQLTPGDLDESTARSMAAITGQFLNLDVAQLRAGSLAVDSAVARKLGAVVGQFVTVDAAQITSAKGRFDQAVIEKLWSDEIKAKLVNSAGIITQDMIATGSVTADKIVASNALSAKVGEFLTVRADQIAANAITSDKIQAGAIDGMVITGPTIQTAKTGARVTLDRDGLKAWNSDGVNTVWLDGTHGRIIGPDIRTSLDRKRVQLTTNGLEAFNRFGTRTVHIDGETGLVSGLTLEGNEINGNRITGGTITGTTINGGTITGTTVEGGTVRGASIEGGTITGVTIQTDRAENRGVKITNTGIKAYDAQGRLTGDINGSSNLLVGRFMTATGGDPSVILMNSTSVGNKPAIFLTEAGGTTGEEAALFLTYNNSLVIRNNKRVSGSEARKAVLVSPSGWAENRFAVGGQWNNVFSGGSGEPISYLAYNHARIGTALQLPNVRSSSFAANVGLANNNEIYKLGSARRLKMDIRPLPDEVDPYRLLSVSPRTWVDRTQMEEYANYLEDRAPDGPNTGAWDWAARKPVRIPGLVAEEVLDAGLPTFVTYEPVPSDDTTPTDGPDGDSAEGDSVDGGEDTTGSEVIDGERVSGLMYDRLWTLLIPICKDLNNTTKHHHETLTTLQNTLKELNNTHKTDTQNTTQHLEQLANTITETQRELSSATGRLVGAIREIGQVKDQIKKLTTRIEHLEQNQA